MDRFDKLIEQILGEGKYHPMVKPFDGVKLTDRFTTNAGKSGKTFYKIPYITKSHDLDGGVIYTAYSNNTVKGDDRADQITPVYTDIKNHPDDDVVQSMIDKAVLLIGGYIYKNHDKPDSMLVIRSSSKLVDEFARKLGAYFKNIEIIPGAIRKADVDKLSIVKDPNDDSKRKNLERVIAKMKNAGEYSSKAVHSSLRIYLGNFMELADELEDKIAGKTVIIVDDILTTRSTMIDSFRQVNQFRPKDVIGVTLFK